MTVKQILGLHNGDEVYWNDPDEGACSKSIIIHSVKVQGAGEDGFNPENNDAIVSIVGQDGYKLECFAHELS